MNDSILVVEDSRFFGSLLRNRLVNEHRLDVRWTRSLAETREALAEEPSRFQLALLDLVLPDAPNGEIVDVVLSEGIPAVILTGQLSDGMRDQMWSRRVVDYVLKNGSRAVDDAVELVGRFLTNSSIKVLVVDDSRTAREHVRQLLEIHRYHVLTAASPVDALACLAEHPDVRLAILDFNMPDMDGEELTRRFREHHLREQLAIVGISTYGSGHLSARFLKAGANDFIYKPFVTEEFYCRVAENFKAQDHLRALERAAFQDYLTGLHNQ